MAASRGTNADSECSLIPYAVAPLLRNYDGGEPYLLVSQSLTRKGDEAFTEQELFPLVSLRCADSALTGAWGPVTLTFADGSVRTVDFDRMEGRLLL